MGPGEGGPGQSMAVLLGQEDGREGGWGCWQLREFQEERQYAEKEPPNLHRGPREFLSGTKACNEHSASTEQKSTRLGKERPGGLNRTMPRPHTGQGMFTPWPVKHRVLRDNTELSDPFTMPRRPEQGMLWGASKLTYEANLVHCLFLFTCELRMVCKF